MQRPLRSNIENRRGFSDRSPWRNLAGAVTRFPFRDAPAAFLPELDHFPAAARPTGKREWRYKAPGSGCLTQGARETRARFHKAGEMVQGRIL
jgi:hypothetical protein